MSSTVSATSSSSSAAPTSQCAAVLYSQPGENNDIVCGVPYQQEYIGFMEDCCKGADVVSYYNNCGLSCLIVDQTVGDFKNCMNKVHKVPDQFPFCSGNSTDDSRKATGTKIDLPASLTASVVGDSSSTSATGTKTASSATGSSTSGSSSSDDKGAAASFGVSKMAVAVGALLLGTFIVA
ncbi:unnamed protein product [Clonostachys rosea f. rosea IK726]|uniref:Uncharacterized protein n=2 Tax=Bionectria ochroleuca TaxID=29856 RepID=A0A8H7N083_BIOOC|nr:unnamed protein product [Clonostachys rosea f. rosea IK726]